MAKWVLEAMESNRIKAIARIYGRGILTLAPISILFALWLGAWMVFITTPLLVLIFVSREYSSGYRLYEGSTAETRTTRPLVEAFRSQFALISWSCVPIFVLFVLTLAFHPSLVRSPESKSFVVVLDSTSSIDKQQHSQILRNVLSKAKRDSEIDLFAMGEQNGGSSLVPLANYESFKYGGRFLRLSGTDRREAFLKDGLNRLSQLPPINNGSLYFTAKEAVERAQSDLGTFERYVIIETDLSEGIQADIKATLEGAATGKYTLPTSIDNRGVQLTLCGFADRIPTGEKPGGRDWHWLFRAERVWQSLFTQPEYVKFEPHC